MSESDKPQPEGRKESAAGRPAETAKALSWHAFIATYLPALILALGTGIALPALPELAKSFDVGFGIASGVVTAFLIGNLFGTVPSGWMIDRFGRRPVLIAGPLLTAATAFLIYFVDSFPQLLVLRFLNGFAAQMWLMARLAAISHGAAAGERGRLVSWMFGMDTTGKLCGPILGGFIAHEWGVIAPFIAYGALSLLALIPTAIFAEDTPRRSATARAESKAAAAALSLRAIIMPRLVYFAVALFAGLTRGPIQADLLHRYAAFAYGIGPIEIGYLATGAALLSLPIGCVAGGMMDRFGRKRTMVPGFSGVTLAMVLLAVSAFIPLGFAWYVMLFFLAVMLQALTGGSIQTVGADVAPPEARGTFLGWWRFVGQGGAATGPVVFALLADHINYGTSFLFTAACACVVAFLLIRHVPETRNVK